MIAAYVLALMMWAQQPACDVDAPNCIVGGGRPLPIFKAATPFDDMAPRSKEVWLDNGTSTWPPTEAQQPYTFAIPPGVYNLQTPPVGSSCTMELNADATWTDCTIAPPPQAEAIDVPAVQVASTSEIVMRGDIMTCSNHGTLTITQSQNECANGFAWTCEDKSRGLWQSEDGHYWCHKAQP